MEEFSLRDGQALTSQFLLLLFNLVHRQDVSFAEIGSVQKDELLVTALVAVDDEVDPLISSDVYLGWLLIGMFFIGVVLMGLETKLERDFIGDCSMSTYDEDEGVGFETQHFVIGFVSATLTPPLATSIVDGEEEEDDALLDGVDVEA